jgi:hypothetical protein
MHMCLSRSLAYCTAILSLEEQSREIRLTGNGLSVQGTEHGDENTSPYCTVILSLERELERVYYLRIGIASLAKVDTAQRIGHIEMSLESLEEALCVSTQLDIRLQPNPYSILCTLRTLCIRRICPNCPSGLKIAVQE